MSSSGEKRSVASPFISRIALTFRENARDGVRIPISPTAAVAWGFIEPERSRMKAISVTAGGVVFVLTPSPCHRGWDNRGATLFRNRWRPDHMRPA